MPGDPENADRAQANPVLTGVHDPTVLEDRGEYVLLDAVGDRVRAYRSRDLVRWEPAGTALRAPDGVRCSTPHLSRDGARLALHVVLTGPDEVPRVHVARSASPAGPFTLDPLPVLDSPAWSGLPFTTEDGGLLLLAAVRGDDGTDHEIVVRTDGAGRPVGTPELLGPADRARPCGPVVQRAGWYHRLRADVDGVRAVRAPAVRGPWTDAVTPVLAPTPGSVTGRPCVVVGPDGATPYALTVVTGPGRTPGLHLSRVRWGGDGPRTGDTATLPGRLPSGPAPVPARPVVDPVVPHRHLRAWVEGGVARVAGADVPLPPRPAVLTAVTDGESVVVRVDGVVVARRSAAEGGLAAPFVVRGGAVRHAVTTSRLEDARHTVLPGGTDRGWPWGGAGPVVAEVAVRGRVTLRLGVVERLVDTVDLCGGNGFAVVVVCAPAGADRLTVSAHSDAEVADVVLAAIP